MKKEFHKNPFGTNYILDLTPDKKNYVSYNSQPCAEMSFFAADDHGSETALQLHGKYFILNGDWREEYLAAAHAEGDPLINCFHVYESYRKEHRSSWSEDFYEDPSEILDWLARRVKNVGGQTRVTIPSNEGRERTNETDI